MITGLNWFPDRVAAVQYYAKQEFSMLDACISVSLKTASEEIFIGTPPARLLNPGDRFILIDGGLRYAIESIEP